MKHAADVHTRLLEAARLLFAKHGYDGTSVRTITRRAKANLGAVTYHFGSKEALYHAVIEQFAVPFADQLAAIAAEPRTARDRVAAVVHAFMEQMAVHPEMEMLIVRELATDRPLPAPVARIIRRNVASVGRIIADGQKDGSIRPGEPALFAVSVVAQPLFLGIARRAIQHALGTDPKDPAIRARIAAHVVATVQAGLANPVTDRNR